MGGRGSSSGMSDKGKKYGTEYYTLYQSGNVKFVRYKDGSATAPLETMTKGRVYVTVDYKDTPKYITYYDKNNKRYKQIDLTHTHFIDGSPTIPHTHKGYLHNEKGDYVPSNKERKVIERILKTWHNKYSKE